MPTPSVAWRPIVLYVASLLAAAILAAPAANGSGTLPDLHSLWPTHRVRGPAIVVLLVLPPRRLWLRGRPRAILVYMSITFITGANDGPGYETAYRIVEQGQTVLSGTPYLERLACTPGR
jgi:hypothetical protein